MLIHSYLEVLELLRPKVFVLENVPGLLKIDGGKEVGEIVAFVRDLGYSVIEPTIVEAADYGVPQYRRRLLIAGAKGGRAPFLPERTHGGDSSLFGQALRPHINVAQALKDLPSDATNHVPRQHTAGSLERYKKLSFGKREKLGRVDRLDPRRPSKTVIAGGMNGGGRSHLHPFLARTLTVRECARLQTFPDHFEFFGNMSRQFTQVGNAVPPLLAEVIARAIGSQFFGLSYDFPPTLAIDNESFSINSWMKSSVRKARQQSAFVYDDLLAGVIR
jgi:DNA (cytosine-5)-methyltransferase 1